MTVIEKRIIVVPAATSANAIVRHINDNRTAAPPQADVSRVAIGYHIADESFVNHHIFVRALGRCHLICRIAVLLPAAWPHVTCRCGQSTVEIYRKALLATRLSLAICIT